MNKRIHTALSIVGLVFLSLVGCDNRENSVGWESMPEYSKIQSHSKEYSLEWETVSADMSQDESSTSANNIYVSSNYGYLGSIPNREYGSIQSEYLTQFYCPSGFVFHEEPLEHRIDSVFIHLYYSSYVGDSIAPMEISAYKLRKPLPFSRLSVSDASKYISSEEILGRVSYYAGRGQGKVASNNRVLHYLSIPLPRSLGQEIYEKSRKGAPEFANQASFDRYFPGIYLKNSAGTGSMIRVERTALTMFYSMRDTIFSSHGVRDSAVIAPHVQTLVHTSEVPQLAIFQNTGLEKLMQDHSSGYAYIKSPAGVLAEITIPTKAIKTYLDETPNGSVRDIVSVPLILQGESQGNQTYDLTLPDNLLLLPKDSVASFFKKEQTEAHSPYTTFLSIKSSIGSTTYNFGNISSLIKNHIATNPEKDLKLWLIPVVHTTAPTQGGGYSSSTTTSISNLVLPSAVKFPVQGSNGKLKIMFTERTKGSPF